MTVKLIRVYMCEFGSGCCPSCHEDSDLGYADLFDYDMACVDLIACCDVSREFKLRSAMGGKE